MTGFILRTLVTALALWVAALIVPGITLGETSTGTDRVVTILLVALLFGVLNALVKPLLQLLGFPLVVVTLGLFLFVINAAMLLLTSWAAGQFGLDFSVDGFWGAALPGAIIVSLVSWVVGALTGVRRD